jgi:hypothetical protein
MDHYPKRDARATIRTVAGASVNLVPFVGGALAAVSGDLIPSRLSRRRDEWFAQVDELLERLDSSDIPTASDAFVDAAVQATIIAISRGGEGRMRLLIAALEGVAGPGQQQEDVVVERMFQHIDQLSASHVLALRQLGVYRRGSVPRDVEAFIASKLREAGWDDGMVVVSMAEAIVKAGFVDLLGTSGTVAYGADKIPDWYDSSSILSLAGQFFVRFLEHFELDSKASHP